MHKSLSASSDWYRDFFHGMALQYWNDIVPEEHTLAEVALLLAQLGCTAGDAVLDMPCGNGRHAIQLAANGIAVTAVDISPGFIEVAKRDASVCGVSIETVIADMAEYQSAGKFSGAYCLGNSFPYLEYDRLQLFIRNVAQSLKSHGRFVIDATSAAECLLPSFQDRDWYQCGNMTMLIENSYHADRGAMETHYTFISDGKTEHRSSLHNVYTAAEIRRMLAAAGFDVVHLLGSTDGELFELGSPQMYIVAEKR